MSGIVGTSHSKSKVIGKSQDTAKAWVRFSQSGSHDIDDSFNVSGVSDQGAGASRCTFISPMRHTNFVAVSGNNDWNFYSTLDTFATTHWEIRCATALDNYLGDVTKVSSLVFGD